MFKTDENLHLFLKIDIKHFIGTEYSKIGKPNKHTIRNNWILLNFIYSKLLEYFVIIIFY